MLANRFSVHESEDAPNSCVQPTSICISSSFIGLVIFVDAQLWLVIHLENLVFKRLVQALTMKTDMEYNT